ncbi:MAG TPA: protein-glutamate O-methyltransferase CheR [Ohtaekwangia sp.]|uniref:CheR family methyltransferase n=1 Tax=Ohtaekwangia sp. TaxID=2066019 RepID=UPI002F9327A9
MNLPYQPVKNIIITDEELRSLTDAIFNRHRIDFTGYEQQSLRRRIIRAMGVFEMENIHELWVRMLTDQSFIYSFMDEISVGLTAMFRDPILWRKIKSLLNEETIANTHLSIWHAGCSTGEEIYTMNIVARESFNKQQIRTWATDISRQAIDIARRGEYHQLKLNEYERNYKEYNLHGSLKWYYQRHNELLVMDKELRRHVTFDYHNLITDSFSYRFDVIFCRNVMIYFDNDTKLKLFDKFYNALNPGGLLIIGFYDAVMPLIDDRKFGILDMDAKIFIKLEEKGAVD